MEPQTTPVQCQAWIETRTNTFEPNFKRWHCRRPYGHSLTRSEPDLTTGMFKLSAERGMHFSDPLEEDLDSMVMQWTDEAVRCGYGR